MASETHWKLAPDPAERWRGQWNETVDTLAKNVIRVQHADLLDSLTKLSKERVRQRALLGEFLRFWIDANSRIMGANKPDTGIVPFSPDFGQYLVRGSGYFPLEDVECGSLVDFPFGERFSKLFLDWFRSIPWLDICWKSTSPSPWPHATRHQSMTEESGDAS